MRLCKEDSLWFATPRLLLPTQPWLSGEHCKMLGVDLTLAPWKTSTTLDIVTWRSLGGWQPHKLTTLPAGVTERWAWTQTTVPYLNLSLAYFEHLRFYIWMCFVHACPKYRDNFFGFDFWQVWSSWCVPFWLGKGYCMAWEASTGHGSNAWSFLKVQNMFDVFFFFSTKICSRTWKWLPNPGKANWRQIEWYGDGVQNRTDYVRHCQHPWKQEGLKPNTCSKHANVKCQWQIHA